MTFERTKDYGLVRKIATNRHVYPHISDDFSPPVDEYRPPEGEAVWYVLVKDGEELLGMWAFTLENAICWKVHTCLLPTAWGKAKDMAKQMAEWIWNNTPCLRIITDVPDNNRLALKLAEDAGMTVFGLNPASYMKSGVLRDQILLGMSKPCR